MESVIRPMRPGDEPVLRELFGEYTRMLVENDAAFAAYLKLQNYAAELTDPAAKYAPPAGRLYLAFCESAAAGCIALHPLGNGLCEMKRLYVRPAFRGQRLAERLCLQLIADARAIGYTAMLLDTLPFLHSALALYKKLGFYPIPCYNDSPLEESVFLRLNL